ncbi:restriction endonuclease subunit S, partial [Enterococcus sp. 5B3_DIV0040]|uniref:restriction endonuclease subunit S n=1 Tax=Enterococcus sp. 5B3_DIV0040 TaxID=1834182 RepID=UPI001594971B
MKCIEDEIPFELPNGWEWSRFSSAFIINPRNSLSDDIEVSFVSMPMIQEGYANNHTFEERMWGKVKSGFTHFANNDIGIAKITPCFENKKSVVFKNLKNGYGAGTTELHIIRTIDNSIYPEYVLCSIKTDAFISNGVNAFSGAVGQKRIGKYFVENSLIPIAPKPEQKRIIERVSLAFKCIDEIDNSKETFQSDISAIKSKILDLAIQGKLVPQDPNDEPASVLLERIRAEKEELIKAGKIKR